MANSLASAIAAIAGKKVVVGDPRLDVCTDGCFSVRDLPFKPLPPGELITSHITHSLEIVRGLANPPNMKDALDAWKNGRKVEEVLHLTTGLPPHDTRYLLTKDDTDPSKWMILRHCHYDPRGSVKNIALYGSGDIYVLDPLPFGAPRMVKPVLHHVLSNITGELLSAQSLTRNSRASGNPSADEVRDGFRYIKDNCPLSNSDNQALQWVELERNDPKSKIFGWRESLVEKAVRNLRHGGSLARIEGYTIRCRMRVLLFRPFMMFLLLVV